MIPGVHRVRDHSWTLDHLRSPVASAFTVLATLVHDSASARGGVGVDEDGEQRLAPAWRAILGNLLNAAMALGAPQLLDDGERATLTAAWAASRFA